jgi:hypothetical protein
MQCTPRKERRQRALELRASPRTGPVRLDARSSPPARATPHSPAPYAGFGARGQANTHLLQEFSRSYELFPSAERNNLPCPNGS